MYRPTVYVHYMYTYSYSLFFKQVSTFIKDSLHVAVNSYKNVIKAVVIHMYTIYQVLIDKME